MGRRDCFLSGVSDLTNASQNKCVSTFVSNLREFKGDSLYAQWSHFTFYLQNPAHQLWHVEVWEHPGHKFKPQLNQVMEPRTPRGPKWHPETASEPGPHSEARVLAAHGGACRWALPSGGPRVSTSSGAVRV